MEDKRTEQRQRVAAAMNDVMEIAKINEVGPLSFSELMLGLASALYRSQGRSREAFLKIAGDIYDQTSREVRASVTKH